MEKQALPQYPDFIEAFNAVEVPPATVFQDAVDAEDLKRAYLEDIKNSLDLSPRTLDAFFKQETKLLFPLDREDAIRRGESGIMTDDSITLLRYCGRQALASVMLIRDDYNYSVLHCAKYPIIERVAQDIRAYQHLERIEAGLA